MRRFKQLAVLGAVAMFSLSCGGSDDPEATPTTSSLAEESAGTLTEVDEETTAPPTAEYQMLSRARLGDALLSISEVPVGYAQEPSDGDGNDDAYCGYEPPSQPDVKVRRDYVKGGGLSSQLISFSIGQYKSEDGPAGYLRDFAKQLEKCASETLDGETVKYALMSVPQLGDEAMGVRVEGESYTLAADLAKVGPVLIVVGGGGLMNTDVDEINDLFEKQVKKYLAAAKN